MSNGLNSFELFVGTLAISLAALPLGADTLADAYVKDGLIAHWDGFDNVASGTHDAAATVWMDRIGGIGIQISDGTVLADSVLLSSPHSFGGLLGANTTEPVTLEIVQRATTGNDGQQETVFMLNNRVGMNIDLRFAPGTFNVSGPNGATLGCLIYRDVADGMAHESVRDVHTYSVVAGMSRALTTYHDGRAVPLGEKCVWPDGNPDKDPTGEGTVGSSIFKPAFYSIRVYNRALSAEEVARNRAVDRMRFEPSRIGAAQAHAFADKVKFSGRFSELGAGTTAVKLLWGYSSDDLTEVAVTNVSGSALIWDFSTTVTVENKKNVYWKFEAVQVFESAERATSTELATVWSDFVPETVAEPVYEINISETTDLAAWMSANGIPSIRGTGTIIKKGIGTLTVTTSALAEFSGDVYLRAGGRIRTTVTNPLGDASGTVYVENGATLECCAQNFAWKPVRIAGEGDDGRGGLYLTLPSAGSSGYAPKNLGLLDDARIGWNERYGGWGAAYLNLNGYSLTVSGVAGWDYIQGEFSGSGHVVIEKTVMFNEMKLVGGDAHDTITIRPEAAFSAGKWTANTPRTLLVEHGAYFSLGTGALTWGGPVVLEGRAQLARQFDFPWPTLTLSGKVTGPGGIGTPEDDGEINLNLSCAENDFKGGVCLSKNVLTLSGNGCLPADGGALTNFNGSVMFLSGAEEYDLPAAYFSGTGLVHAAGGAYPNGQWRGGLIKSGAGELVYATAIGSPVLSVEGGTFNVPVADAAASVPAFDEVFVRAGATLCFAPGYSGTLQVDSLGGGGVVSNCNVEVGQALVISDDVANRNALQVSSGRLTFAEHARVDFPDGLILPSPHGRPYVVATAQDIVAAPEKTNRDDWGCRVVENEDGTKSLRLYRSVGMVLTVW